MYSRWHAFALLIHQALHPVPLQRTARNRTAINALLTLRATAAAAKPATTTHHTTEQPSAARSMDGVSEEACCL
jgi:hypothetical protein